MIRTYVKIRLGTLRRLIIESMNRQIRVRDEVTWSGEAYDVMWASSASNIDDSFDLPDEERSGTRRGTPVPSNWYAYISSVKTSKGRYVPVSELSPNVASGGLDPALVARFSKYVSSPEDPRFTIRFTSHVPDADRVGNHTIVPNGVYTFAFTQDVCDFLCGDDHAGFGIYIEDIGLNGGGAVIMRCKIRNPLVLDDSSFADILDMSKKLGHVGAQEELLSRGYDAIIDPNDLIDGNDQWHEAQVCFLSNSAFEVVDRIKRTEAGYA